MKQLRDESGQTLVMVAVSLSLLLGFAAFATDVGVMLHEKRLAQSAADSAAIAAATAISQHGNGTTAGKTDAAINGFTDQATDSSGNVVTTVTISTTPGGYFAGKTGYVEAVITQQTPTFFMRMFGTTAMTINSTAVATYLGSSDFCGGALDPTGSPTAANPWGNSIISAPNCSLLFNGNVVLGASDSVNAKYIGTSGTITGTKALNGGAYGTGIPQFTDPYAYLSAPGALPTDNNNGTCTSPANADGTAGPACYLNKALVGGTPLPAGVYFYDNPSAATYTGNVTGTDVTIVLTNGSLLSNSGGSGAGNASLTLGKLTDNSLYSGVVIDSPTLTGELNLDFGATVSTYTGLVYAPQADLSLQDQGANGKSTTGAGVTINGGMIVGTLDVYNKNNGNLTINNTSGGGGGPFPRISLVE